MDLKDIFKLSLIIMILNPTSRCMSGLNIQGLWEFAKLLHDIGQYWNMTSIYIIHHSRDIKSNEFNMIKEELRTKGGYFAELPHMSITEESFKRQFYMDNGFSENSLVLTLMDSVSDGILKMTAAATRHRRQCFTIYVLQQEPAEYYIHILFSQLWQLQLQRPLVVANDKVLLTLNSYPDLRIHNVTGSHVSKLFPIVTNTRDFKGYNAVVPIQIDIPSTFWYKHKKSQEIVLDGFGVKIVSEFAQQFNLTLVVAPYYLNYSNVLDSNKLIEILKMGSADISPDFFTAINQSDNDYTYPYVTTSRCIMIPTPTANTILLTDLVHWTLLVLVLIFVVINEIFWTAYYHLAHLQYKGHYVAEVFRSHSKRFIFLVCVFLWIPIPSLSLPPMKYIRSWRFFRIIFVYYTATMSGFFVSQMLSTNFISLLTASYYKEHSANLKDILSSEIPIMVNEAEYGTLVQGINISQVDVRQIVKVSNHEASEKRASLDTSYMYFVTKESFKIINEQQRYLNTKRFVLTDLCYGTSPMHIQLRADSAFSKPLYIFTLRLHESGIFQYLKSNLFQRAKEHGKLRYFRDTPKAVQFALYNESGMISMMAQILGIGYIGSTIAFIVEMIDLKLLQTWSRLKNRLSMNTNN